MTIAQMRLFAELAAKQQRRAIANQVRAMSLAIAQAFGSDISGALKELDE